MQASRILMLLSGLQPALVCAACRSPHLDPQPVQTAPPTTCCGLHNTPPYDVVTPFPALVSLDTIMFWQHAYWDGVWQKDLYCCFLTCGLKLFLFLLQPYPSLNPCLIYLCKCMRRTAMGVHYGFESPSQCVKYMTGSHDQVGCQNNGGWYQDYAPIGGHHRLGCGVVVLSWLADCLIDSCLPSWLSDTPESEMQAENSVSL